MVWQHIYPLHDLKPHDTASLDCACGPRLDWNDGIAVHHAWDCREAVEWAEAILRESDGMAP